MIRIHEIETPLGPMSAAQDARGLRALAFSDHLAALEARLVRRFGTIVPAAARGDIGERLTDYFAGSLEALAGLSIEPEGTPFQRMVWEALRGIPVGGTVTYGTVARWIGRPSAVRAVGAANGQNPIALVVPCHRVIGADGTLTGYAGGLSRKEWLLGHERQYS